MPLEVPYTREVAGRRECVICGAVTDEQNITLRHQVGCAQLTARVSSFRAGLPLDESLAPMRVKIQDPSGVTIWEHTFDFVPGGTLVVDARDLGL